MATRKKTGFQPTEENVYQPMEDEIEEVISVEETKEVVEDFIPEVIEEKHEVAKELPVRVLTKPTAPSKRRNIPRFSRLKG